MQMRARQLRQEQTLTEAKLWQVLRSRQLKSYKFRRQHPIGRFIVDFCCPELRFIVEVDGAVHQQQDQICRDEERTAMLQSMGYRVYRLTNEEVETNLPGVLDTLYQTLAAMALASARSSPLPLKRERGQG
jgi:very-short-patch-repair endonuclease